MLSSRLTQHAPSGRTVRANRSAPCRLPVIAQAWRDDHQPSTSGNVAQLIASVSGAIVLLQCGMASAAPADVEIAAKAVSEYIELDAAGKFAKGGKMLDDFRNRYHIRRGADGRLQVQSASGEWFQCRLDMEVPGSMLLRDSKGNIFALQTEVLQQIDLSDDVVALMMFSGSDWQAQMSPVEYVDDSGKSKQLQLQEKEFREVIGLLKEVAEASESGQSQPTQKK